MRSGPARKRKWLRVHGLLVGGLTLLDVADDLVGNGQHENFDEGLPDESDDDVVDEVVPRRDADDARGNGAEDQRVEKLADDRRPDQARPQVLFLGAFLDGNEDERIEHLPDEIARQACKYEAWHDPDHRFEGFLILVEARHREFDDDEEAHRRQDDRPEAEIDRTSGRLEAVDLTEHIAEDVSEREQEECAVHICRRIYKWFVYDVVHEPVVEAMAFVLRENDYELRPALEFLFNTEHFYDSNFRGANIQNPMSLLPGLVRKFGMEEFTYPEGFFLRSIEFLGMTPLEPPDVNGWTGYRSWINSITLPVRKLINSALVTGFSPFGNFDFTVDVRSIAQTMYNSDDDGYASEQIVRKLALVLFGVPLSDILETKMLDILLDGAEPYDWNINAPIGDAQWNRMKDLLLYMIKLPEIQLS